MDKRREEAEANYRQKFEALNLEGFEFLRREWSQERDRRFWVRCKKCGAEFLRFNDVLRGKTKTLNCRQCGNGTNSFMPFVEEVLQFYRAGHSISETSNKFNIKKSTLNNWVKTRRVTNGRTFEEGGRESNKARAEAAVVPGRVSRNASHYRRAKLHGAPAEVGITLQKLIERNGLTCAICGLPCFYFGNGCTDLYPTIDHIVPISKGGGHTWNNVQIAHRLCNVNKRDHIGREWNNAD